jgi:competence protein ComEA
VVTHISTAARAVLLRVVILVRTFVSRVVAKAVSIRTRGRGLRDRVFAAVDGRYPDLVALARRAGQSLVPLLALVALVLSMGGTWHFAAAAPATIAEEMTASARARGEAEPAPPPKKAGRELTGKLNLNTATEDQLLLLPTIGPAKAERIVTWRKKNGGFKRTADLRRVKGFGYKTFKRLEPFLDIKGDTTLH